MIDSATIHVASGAGGNGAISGRHERYVPKGGPDGGDGGDGGSVIIYATESVTTLYDYRYRKKIKADRGKDGSSNKKHGARAFTKVGALALAKHVEQNIDKKKPWRRIVKTFFDRRHNDYVRLCVMERVANVGGVKNGIAISNVVNVNTEPKNGFIPVINI